MISRFDAIVVSSVLAAAVAASPAVAARQDALPSGRDVVGRHIEAVGGSAAQRAVKSIHARGRIDMPAQGISGAIEVFAARPNRILMRAEIPDVGRIENAFDGKVGWSIDPLAGPALLTGSQLTEMADDAVFDGVLYEPPHVRDVTTLGRTTFDARPAFRVRVQFASGREHTEYFDAETGLQLGMEATRETPLGPAPTQVFFRDYRQFGALRHATTIVQRTMGLEQVVSVTELVYDTVPATAFDPPPAVKALIKPPRPHPAP